MKYFVKIAIIIIIAAIAAAIFVSYKIETTITTLGQTIEQRALPVLRMDIPIIKKNLFKVVPSVQGTLDTFDKIVPLGPLSPGKIFDKTVDVVKKPIVTAVLEHTRKKLNQELSFVKIEKLDYEQRNKQRTFTAYCSYSITVILTGRHFNRITSTERNNWRTVTFVCD